MKILIVDSEPGLAAGLAEFLTAQGFSPPGVASTSDDAVDWINREGVIDLLVTDVFLEPSDGLTLRETIQPHLPEMKTIFVSAYDLTDYQDRLAGYPSLAKPVSGQDLLTAIRQIFPSQSPTPSVAVAQPQPVASSQPRAVTATPKAVASASPKATVAGTPKAVAATPQAKAAAPRAVASAAAVPQAAAVAPKAAAVASQAAAVASQAAAPKAVAASPKAPQATAAPQAVPSAPQAAAAVSAGGEVELPLDGLVGTTLGNYVIEAKIGQASLGAIYRALQSNMGRKVRFYVLDAEQARDPELITRFISNASVKANVSHPSIFAVYEAGENGGTYYYSCEYVPCRSLRQMRLAGEFLDESAALQSLKTAAGALAYLGQQNIGHEMISDNAILIGPGNRPRIANTAAHQPARTFDTAEEIRSLGTIIQNALPENSRQLGVRELAATLASGSNPNLRTWAAVLQAVTALEPKVAPKDAYKLDAQERAAIRMMEEAKKKQKRKVMTSSLVSLALLALALLAIYYAISRPKGGTAKVYDRVIKIPAGEFIYQDGEKVNLPAFDIDEYEVTIGQYAEFLDFLAKNPSEAAKFEHPKQPKGKSHVPVAWADQDLATGIMYGYYTRAQRWGRYQDADLNVNSPVFGVDWYDAYAYAKWKGRRLPTEQEWEKAGRGKDGAKFAWGNSEDPSRANTGVDVYQGPKKGGEKDGFKKWAPVDAKSGDKSPYGVMGMSGNVSEWTGTFDTDPQMTSTTIPVIRGGNWKNPDHTITRRVLVLPELNADDGLGFRTVSDTPPSQP